ncbi:MAG TPA: hypothetical protein VGQ55_05265, partial [Pyrinomonadaceae bacterium]|nr:hypothetical protein [Pyrinomonadaceae bacterium]
MSIKIIKTISIRALAAGLFSVMMVPGLNAQTNTAYKTVKIDGLDIFYREAGDPSKPTILLLHGFPASSHM